MIARSLIRRGGWLGAWVLVTTLASCVDAPAGPEGAGPAVFVIAPAFSLVGPSGQPPMTSAQKDALSAAFDQVDRFRMVVKRAADNAVALDTIISVKPGMNEYDLTVPISAKPDEQFLVTLTALQGATTLFTAENIPAKAAASAPGAAPPAAVQIPLVYTGPGATATSVSVGPAQAVLAPGGSATLGASVKDAGGSVIAGVPLAWASSATGVATVSGSGAITAVADGLATVTATTPMGLAASATVYVVAGELAYVEAGALKVRGAAGGTAVQRASGGAAQPAWSADGARLYYVSGGMVSWAGGGPLASGSWPSVSPDGTKLAVERGGQVWFINDDGGEATQGPGGTAPVWADASTLLVGGGSVQRVRADGTARTTVVEGAASLPALAGDGRIASVISGDLRVTGVGRALVTGATGRPTWSPNGRWLVVGTSSGLVLAPADGSAGGVALPGLAAATDPAFKRAGAMSAAPSVSVTGFSPDPPVPGTQVRVLGSGFDWIIRTNNHVTWPTRDGSATSEVGMVTEGSITTTMPRNVAAGQVKVETRTGTGLLAFVPTVGSLEVTASTPWSSALAGVGVALSGPGGPISGTTDANGSLVLSGLIPGTYTVTLTPPSGWEMVGASVRTLSIGAEASTLTLQLNPIIASVTLSPAAPALAVGSTLPVTLVVTGADGHAIPQAQGLTWKSGSAELVVTPGAGLGATLSATFPGEGTGSSTFAASFGGKTYTFGATVTSGISGTLTKETGDTPPPPAPDITVQVRSGGTVVAEAKSGSDGRYTVRGLFRGTYDVAPLPAADLLPVPAGQTVILGDANPSGRADFKMQSFAGLDVTAKTPWDGPVSGVGITLLGAAGGEVAKGTTDPSGTWSAKRLPAGAYTLKITAPAGFALTGEASRSLTLKPGAQSVALQLTPVIQSVSTIPEELSVEVGSTLDVELVVKDINDRPIPQVQVGGWTALSGHLAAGGISLRGQIGGKYPSALGEAQLGVELNGRLFALGATVTSHVSGTVTQTSGSGSAPVQGVLVVAEKDGKKFAEALTLGNGTYRLTRLVAGTYTVKPNVPADKVASPASTSVTLGSATPTGTANFTITQAVVGGADRPNVMQCGYSSRNVTSFFPAGSNLTLVSGCVPDANTQAILINRHGAGQINASVIQSYVIAGGIVLTEWSTSAPVWNAIFGTQISNGSWSGRCYDLIPAVVQFSSGDPFWQANPWQPIDPNYSGCGYSITHFPGLTPLMGWSSSAVGIGYRDLGAGRVWATEFDWQDLDSQYYGLSYAYTEKLMGYMISHRATAYVPPVAAEPLFLSPSDRVTPSPDVRTDTYQGGATPRRSTAPVVSGARRSPGRGG